MTYEEALAFIHGTYAFGSKLGLENIQALLEKLDHPEKALKVIHVAGTNGKGSTSAFLQSILMQAGYRVGLYTSPYLERFTERMRINQTEISETHLAELTEEVKEAVDSLLSEGHSHPTEFEIVTAIGFLYFKREKVDFLILEVGLGGRLDATNVVEKPLVSVITPVSMDHQAYLGNDLVSIAGEKAGIIKPGRPVVVGLQKEAAFAVIEKRARELEAPLIRPQIERYKLLSKGLDGIQFSYENHIYQITLVGLYQVENALLALEVARCLRQGESCEITDDQMRWGLAKAQWAGRFEVIKKDPLLIIDGAHNDQGIEGLVKTLNEILKDRPKRALFGVLADKEVDAMVAKIAPVFEEFVLTRPDNPRALAPEALREKIWQASPGAHVEIIDDIDEATAFALEDLSSSALVAFGSLYMIGRVRTALKKRFE